VLLVFFAADLGQPLQWLTLAQPFERNNGRAGTPGPVFTTATSSSHVLRSWRGALVATAGKFLLAFVFIWLSVNLVGQQRQPPLASASLSSLNAAS
jgi:hypothetical protein